MDVALNHDKITWYKPGNTSYWFRVGLASKSTRAIKVKALRGHTIQLVEPNGVTRNMSYNSSTDYYEVDTETPAYAGYETASDAKSPNQLRYYVANGYRLIVDGVEYSFDINGLKLQRD